MESNTTNPQIGNNPQSNAETERSFTSESMLTEPSASSQRMGTGGTARKGGDYQGDSDDFAGAKLARGLAWFSIGLGLAEFLAPESVANMIGVEREHSDLIRAFGLREIASGIAIFMQGERPTEAMWARVAGDAMDLASLGAAFSSSDSDKARLGIATANVLAVTALDVLCAQRLGSGNGTNVASEGNRSTKTLIIDRPPDELYRRWHDFEQLPNFMQRIESVRITGPGRSHWVAKGPVGLVVEWDAEIIEDRPNELIRWASLEGADVRHSGSVRFEPAPGNRGTIVKVQLDYKLAAGTVGAKAASVFREDPGELAIEALRCFKQMVEAGEVMVSDGTIWDNGFLTQRPARPLGNEQTQQQGIKSRAHLGKAATAYS